jgi:hypothetical protein
MLTALLNVLAHSGRGGPSPLYAGGMYADGSKPYEPPEALFLMIRCMRLVRIMRLEIA